MFYPPAAQRELGDMEMYLVRLSGCPSVRPSHSWFLHHYSFIYSCIIFKPSKYLYHIIPQNCLGFGDFVGFLWGFLDLYYQGHFSEIMVFQRRIWPT